MKITAYADRTSVAPDETINFMVNCNSREFKADFVKLICGDMNPDGPGYKEKVIRTSATGIYPGKKQTIYAGSFVQINKNEKFDRLESFTMQAFIWPTTPNKGHQTIVGNWSEKNQNGMSLAISPNNNGLMLTIGSGPNKVQSVVSGKPFLEREWYFVAATYDAEKKRITLIQEPLHTHAKTRDRTTKNEQAKYSKPKESNRRVTIGAQFKKTDKDRTVCQNHFNGKIDSPLVASRAMTANQIEQLKTGYDKIKMANDVIAAWDFSADISSVNISDLSGNNIHGKAINMPVKAMTGWNWNGEEMNWKHAPKQYGAIHFHDDDVHDAGWEVDVSLKIPKKLKSGLYAIRLRAGNETTDEDYVPFVILPPRGKVTANICFILPTATYMAYANEHMGTDSPIAQLLGGRLVEHDRQDLYRNEHREYGASCYDTHTDGSGVCYSSRLRPILNMRPKYKSWLGGKGSTLWQFNADTHITDWLEAQGYNYDVITDEELHYNGVAALEKYRVVLSSSHPEYHSKEMWDAMSTYQKRGGRLMYLGANGWYWRIAFHQEVEGILEVRRAEGGIRGWEAQTGEYYHSFTGEYGGLWRRNGRAPQKIVGTGFTAQGFDISSYYKRKPDSFKKPVQWIMNGVEDDELIGNFGLIGGGAAGLELDRADTKLGTHPDAYILASSEDHTDLYLVVCEELLINYPGLGGQENQLVRADLVFYETDQGGGVFSTSSIAWPGALSHNNYVNNVSKITKNVLDRFVKDGPLLD